MNRCSSRIDESCSTANSVPARNRLVAVGASTCPQALCRQNRRQQLLNVEVLTRTNDGQNDFDFDAQFSIVIDH